LRHTKDGCTVTYKATGVFANNRATCATDDPTAPFYRAEGYNPALCDPEPDFSQGIAVGSGINPDFPVACDPASRLCLLQGEFPSFRLADGGQGRPCRARPGWRHLLGATCWARPAGHAPD
ncbi:MAG TPA: hypothetical protein VFS00_28925, partial [Polyangiaceae bacterium]|nr:hypothetical protein [Polyangiaceae bacterium]